MALKGPSASQLVLMLIVGVVFMVLITSIIDFNAINSDDEDAKIFKENVDYEALGSTTFTWLITAMAMFMAWRIVMGEGRWDRKKLVSLALTAIVLYFLYNKILAPQLDLTPIEFAAYQLQSIVAP